MSNQYLAGYGGIVKIGTSTTIPVKSWKATVQTDELDSTTTTSGGKREFMGGLSHVEFSFEALWDAAQMPFNSTAPNLQTGTFPHVTLGVGAAITSANSSSSSGTGASTVDMPTAFIGKVDVDLAADGQVKYTVSGKSSGSYTIATT